MLSNRSTFIGFGKKSDIGTNIFSPSPDKYEKQSEFDTSLKKGCSFGLSRDSCKAVALVTASPNPGPGAYTLPKEDSKGFLVRGRDGFPKIFQSQHTPGPGQCNIQK